MELKCILGIMFASSFFTISVSQLKPSKRQEINIQNIYKFEPFLAVTAVEI